MTAELVDASSVAEAAARQSYGKLLAFLAARTRDVASAEDALADAFAAALSDWPERGVPDNPEGWLLTVARRKQIDSARRRKSGRDATLQLRWTSELALQPGEAFVLPDRRLGLLFACAHPAIEASARAPLMLQVVLGFNAATIASAFLVAPGAMGQRLSRAKAKIRDAGISLEVPDRGALRERLGSVLDAVYAVYAEGWSDPEGGDARRRNLADEAIWLGRLLGSLLPDEPDVLGLLSLMLHTHARRYARRNASGDYVPLDEQDARLWDTAMIDEAEALLSRASQSGEAGRYQLEAAVQSAHAVRRRTGHADWGAIVELYDALCVLTDSPVAKLNRAVSLSHIGGAAKGLAALDTLADDPRLAEYQPYWAARADLLAKAERFEEALEAYRQAIGLERDPAVRRFLQERAKSLQGA